MPFNNIVSRTDAAVLMPEEVAAGIIDALPYESAALTLFPQVRMGRAQLRMPVVAALPTAYFVSGDTGLKQTTEMGWANKYLNVEELAAIVVVPDNVLSDSDQNIFDTIRPKLVQAIGKALDAAIFFGTNKPASWPTAIVPLSITAGNVVTRGTATAAAGGIAGDISALFSTIEADGYVVSGIVSNSTVRGLVRNLRDTTGQRLDDPFYGIEPRYTLRGLWPTGSAVAELIAGDFSEGLIGIREDISFQVDRSAVVQDGTGAIIFNTFQQDLTAIRVTFRVAWSTRNSLDPVDAGTIYPFGVLRTP